MPIKIHAQDTLDRYVIRAIGLIAAEWSLCETYVAVAIWKMLDVTWEQGHILTDDLGPSPRIKTFHAIAKDKFQEAAPHTYAKAKDLYERLGECNSERNNLVHNVWSATGADKYAAQKFTARSGQLKITPLSKTGDEIIQSVEKIQILADDMDDFIKSDLGGLPPSRSKR